MTVVQPPVKPPKVEHNAFPTREDGVRKIEVHVAGICAREIEQHVWEILAAKRSPSRSLFPNKWECGGGMVRKGESFQAALKRQMFEEFGLSVNPQHVIECYQIHVPNGQQVIPGVRMLCFVDSGKITLNERELVAYKWLRLPVAESLDWIGGIKEAIDIATGILLGDYIEAPRKAPRSQMGFNVPADDESIRAFVPTQRNRHP